MQLDIQTDLKCIVISIKLVGTWTFSKSNQDQSVCVMFWTILFEALIVSLRGDLFGKSRV